MLDRLRAEALALIAAAPQCTLSTSGPAGLRASIVTCTVIDKCIYILAPVGADHLYNLEQELDVVLTAVLWQVQGAALVLGDDSQYKTASPPALQQQASNSGAIVIEIFPLRIHLEASATRRHRETVDFAIPALEGHMTAHAAVNQALIKQTQS